MRSEGEEEVDGEAQVVAYKVANEADGDAEDGEVAVVEEGGDEGDEGRGVDECHGGDEGGVAVESEDAGKEDLQQKGAEDDEKDVPEDVEAAGEVELADVAGVGDGEAEEVDEVEAYAEG